MSVTLKANTEACNRADATGFIRLNALHPAGGIAARVQRKK
jgi:hypothetical protein